MKKSRIVNVTYNFTFGILRQILKLVCNFGVRTVFIYFLGKEYLGIDGLFLSIISVLNLAELGIESGIIYCLYRPIAENDIYKIQAYMKYYKKAYMCIGCIIAMVGLCLVPYLPFLMKGVDDIVNVKFIYLLYLGQTVVSYIFFAYRSALFTASQKKSILHIIQSITIVGVSVFQILDLIFLKSFVGYIMLGLGGNIFNNILVAIASERFYPEIWKKNDSRLTQEERCDLKKKICGLAMYKFSGTVLSSTDNLIISGFIGTSELGLYTNYTLLFQYIQAIPALLFDSLTASIGNINVVENKEKKLLIFKKLNFLNFWIYGFSGIEMLCITNYFIEEIWIGKDYLLNNSVVIFLFLNYITAGLQQTVIAHKDACGLFWEGRWRPVFSGVLNLVISILLVRPFGIEGVIVGTIISRFLTTWWFDPWLIYKYVFEEKPYNYYVTYVKRLIYICLIAVLTLSCTTCIKFTGWIGLLIRLAICTVLPNACFWLLFRKTDEYEYLKEVFINLIFKIIRRKK